MLIPAQYVPDYLAKFGYANANNNIIDFERSEGSYFIDLASGKKYLDCYALNGTLPLGYGHHAYTRRDKESGWVQPPPYKIPHADIYSSEYTSFLHSFMKVMPSGFTQIALTDSDNEAMRQSLAVARAYRPLNDRLLWNTTAQPYVSFPMAVDQDAREKKSLEQIKSFSKIGAIIISSLSLDNRLYRPSYLQSLRNLSDEIDALLIFDERHTGFGASGNWWCFQSYEVEPDMFVFGGKSQVSGIVANTRVGKLPKIRNSCSFQDMDRCLHIIQAIDKEDLIRNTKGVGEYLIARLRQIETISAFVSNVRGLGTLVAFDLPDSTKRNKILTKLNQDIIISSAGDKSIMFRPALTFSKEDVDLFITFLRKALK